MTNLDRVRARYLPVIRSEAAARPRIELSATTF
jgi:hypothetical protein